MTDKKHQYTNRLVNEKSPYLLQHAHNPVDWYPWGEEAFEKAKREDKPIFLSIGYSTCHWCHVMEKESFEDEEVAKLMNEIFVSIKVDREERPEIDNLYMSICQMITGSGGWPLTIIMDAEKRPFTAGTYFPKTGRFGSIGMMELLPRIKDLWINERERLEEASKEIMDQLQITETENKFTLKKEILDEAFNEATLFFDNVNGGFRGAPKFPTPHKLLFLLRYWKDTGKKLALAMVEKTLTEMRKGGIYDHIGFGFHRYSTDSQWLLPHFEKMLYDQALLSLAYIETYLVTKNDFYRKVTEEIFEYVLRDMTSSEGAFYSAEDADSEGEEGLFYTWTEKEIEELLGEADGKLFCEFYNFDADGNYIEQATRVKTGRNIPHIKKSLGQFAKNKKLTLQELEVKFVALREILFKKREERIHPHKDDKILVDWNGLMIAALAYGGRSFNEQRYIDAAEKAASFLLDKMLTKENRLLHRFRDQEAAIQGLVDDYVFFIWGLLELYQSTFSVNYLRKAIELNEILINHFWDSEKGGLFITPDDGEELLVRSKIIYDGALPSGNSVAMLNFLKIGRITADIELEEKAEKIASFFGAQIEQALFAHSMLLSGLEYVYGSAFEIVIVGHSQSSDAEKMLQSLNSEYIPNKIILFYPIDTPHPEIEELTDFVKYKESIEGKATAHVCVNRFCKFPTAEIPKMLELLQTKKVTEK